MNNRQVFAFRADASLQIGTGHVMRCLTLADALTAQGAECHFICRDLPGHMGRRIAEKGHRLHLLPAPHVGPDADGSPHACWLDAPQDVDANLSMAALQDTRPDWLVVDHYALDNRW